MSFENQFTPSAGSGAKITTGVTAAGTQLKAGTQSMRVTNFGATPVYFTTYKNSDGIPAWFSAAPSSGCAVPQGGAAGSVIVVKKPADHDSIAHAADSGTPIIHAMMGEGG